MTTTSRALAAAAVAAASLAIAAGPAAAAPSSSIASRLLPATAAGPGFKLLHAGTIVPYPVEFDGCGIKAKLQAPTGGAASSIGGKTGASFQVFIQSISTYSSPAVAQSYVSRLSHLFTHCHSPISLGSDTHDAGLYTPFATPIKGALGYTSVLVNFMSLGGSATVVAVKGSEVIITGYEQKVGGTFDVPGSIAEVKKLAALAVAKA